PDHRSSGAVSGPDAEQQDSLGEQKRPGPLSKTSRSFRMRRDVWVRPRRENPNTSQQRLSYRPHKRKTGGHPAKTAETVGCFAEVKVLSAAAFRRETRQRASKNRRSSERRRSCPHRSRCHPDRQEHSPGFGAARPRGRFEKVFPKRRNQSSGCLETKTDSR